MNDAIEFAVARITKEEGFRQYPYNDKTGARVSCLPDGNLSWLYGINLETEGCSELGTLILRWKLGKINDSLKNYSWFTGINSARASVLLDIAYNSGVAGLLKYPRMLKAITIGDWVEAKAQCHPENPRLLSRYDALGDILLSGVI
jgi:GH24 family phage-related lysozyme (muramidase)